MEQSKIPTSVRKVTKKNDSSSVRFSKDFMKKVSKLVDRANRKSFGKRVKLKMILESLFNLADEKLLEDSVKKAQENSLSHSDKREAFLKERLSTFNGSKEQLELKMMEVFDQHLSQNQS